MWLFCLLDPFIPTQIKFLATPLLVVRTGLHVLTCTINYKLGLATCCRRDRATLKTTVAVDDRRGGTAMLVERARRRPTDDDPAATGTAAAGIVVDAMRCSATTTDSAAADGAITADTGRGDGSASSSSSWLQVEVDGRSSLAPPRGSLGAGASLPSHVGWSRLSVVDSAMDPSSFNVSDGYACVRPLRPNPAQAH